MRRTLGNKGFSLLELLVAIAILGVILVPMATAFVVSQNTASRAKEVRNQTMAGQNVVEAYKATEIEALVADLKKGTQPLSTIATGATLFSYDTASASYVPMTASTTDDGTGSQYMVRLTGVQGGAKTYDAMLYLNATGYAGNTTQVVSYRTMDALYNQPDPTKNDSDDPDLEAASTIAEAVLLDKGTGPNATYFLSSMNRTVTITISKVGTTSGTITCTALFHYESYYSGKNYTVDVTKPFYNGTYTATTSDFENLYFLYYPNSLSQRDTFVIENPSNVDCSVSLVPMCHDLTYYLPSFTLYETYDSALSYDKQINHATMNYPNKTYPLKIFFRANGIPWAAVDPKFTGEPVDMTLKNRLYDVSVDIYKAGSGFAGGALSSYKASSFTK